MGNRAIINIKGENTSIYLHWNGGYDSVSAFLEYAKLKGMNHDSSYATARLCQIIGNFFGGNLSIGVLSNMGDMSEKFDKNEEKIKALEEQIKNISTPKEKKEIQDRIDHLKTYIAMCKYATHRLYESAKYQDNGAYVCDDDFNIVKRIAATSQEQNEYDLTEMLIAINKKQPIEEQLEEDFFTAEVVKAEDLKVGDVIYFFNNIGCKYEKLQIVGIGEDRVINGSNVKGYPYVNRWGQDSPADNPNNYVGRYDNFEVRKVKAKAVTSSKVNFEINSEHNGIEISFGEKPSDDTRTKLKENGFRWHKTKKVWYAKNTDERLAFVKELIK